MQAKAHAPFTAARVVVGAIIGALASSIVMSFVRGYRWVERTSESGGIAYNMVWFIMFLWDTLLLSPWGLLGALGGVAVSLRLPKRQSNVRRDRFDS